MKGFGTAKRSNVVLDLIPDREDELVGDYGNLREFSLCAGAHNPNPNDAIPEDVFVVFSERSDVDDGLLEQIPLDFRHSLRA